MKAKRVVVVGSINIDLVTRAEKIPIPGETVIGGDLQTFPGGKGANQAVAAARMGAEVAMVGHVGNDAFAQQLRQSFAYDDVNQNYVTEVEAPTGVALIIVDATGQNSIVVASGANRRLLPSAVDAAARLIATADVMLLQLEVPLETIEHAAQIAHDAGVQVILNPAPAQIIPAAILKLVDILVPNESEAAVLTGSAVDDQEGQKAAATKLLSLGVSTVILTLGSRGALLAHDGDVHSISRLLLRRMSSTQRPQVMLSSVVWPRPLPKGFLWRLPSHTGMLQVLWLLRELARSPHCPRGRRLRDC